jgi:phosphoesterase RecJ-like protein
MMKIPKKILSALRDDEKFLVAAHINPDGDAIGSAVALGLALESMGKEAVIYSKDPVPLHYTFLPGQEKIRSVLEDALEADPVLILVDCNSPERAGIEGHRFRRSIVIDHHETGSDFGDLKWIDHKAAACGSMVYAAIKSLGVKITKAMATNLYAAIAVDTGTFRYANTTAEVLRTGAELVDLGAQPGLIAERLYETWNIRRFRLFMMTLNTLEIKNDIAITHVTGDMLRRTGAKAEDTENFSNLPRRIDSVKISVLLREIGKGTWKVSLRSKGDVDVAKIAEHFGGGGHKNAAGFRIKADLKSAKEALLHARRKLLRR